MSLNMYVSDKVKELPGFTSTPYEDGSGDNMRINGLHLFDGKGRLYAMLGDENSVVPANLKDHVEGFSFYEFIPQVAHRETGVYRHKSAEAEVEDNWGGSKRPQYRVKIIGKELADVHDLFRMIKLGSIRPEESYENPQKGLSYAELEKKLRCALDEKEEVAVQNDYLADQLNTAHATIRENAAEALLNAEEKLRFRNVYETRKNSALRRLAHDLLMSKWVVCNSKKIAQKINKILDSSSS